MEEGGKKYFLGIYASATENTFAVYLPRYLLSVSVPEKKKSSSFFGFGGNFSGEEYPPLWLAIKS